MFVRSIMFVYRTEKVTRRSSFGMRSQYRQQYKNHRRRVTRYWRKARQLSKEGVNLMTGYIACSRRSDSGERCEVKRSAKK